MYVWVTKLINVTVTVLILPPGILIINTKLQKIYEQLKTANKENFQQKVQTIENPKE